jgi:pyrophosphatase PpaX
MRVVAVMFDLDGTLIDSFALIEAAFRHASRTVLGRPPTDEEVLARWGEPLPVRAAHLVPDPRRAAEWVRAYTAYYDAHHDRECRLFPGIPEMLAELASRGCALGIVTSKRPRSTMQAVERFGLGAWIRAVVTAEDVPAPKPAPDPIALALGRLAAHPPEALMVGDGVFDIQAARAAGVRSVAAMWGTREGPAVLAAAPDHVARRPADLVSLVAESGG